MNLPQIPGYQFEELVGEGGCGAVFRCTFEDGSTRMVKVLNGLAINHGLLSHALTSVVNLPQHPNLEPIHAFNLAQTPYFYATDYYAFEGTNTPSTLEYLLGRLKSKVAWRLIEQLVSGLAFLHQHEVIHASVKPGNIFVSHDANKDSYQLFLGDFGQGLVTGLHYFEMGSTGYYASPEQLANGDFTHGKGKRWDVYSFGVVAFQLLTGCLPRMDQRFRQYLDEREQQSRDETAVLRQEDPRTFYDLIHQEEEVVWPIPPKNEYEAQLRAVVERCLNLDPAKRPVDAREIARGFEKIRYEADTASLENRFKAQLRGKNIRIKVLLGTTGIFVLASLLLLGSALLGFSFYGTAMEEVRRGEQAKKDALKKQEEAFREKVATEENLRIEAQEGAAMDERLAAQARNFLKYSQSNADTFFEMILSAGDVDLPGFQSDRREALEKAALHYQAFINDYGGDEEFRRSLAKAHRYLGQIRKSQGRLSGAVVELLAARDILDEINTTGRDLDLVRQAGTIERSVAEIEIMRGDLEGAQLALNQSSQRFQTLQGVALSDRNLFDLTQNVYLTAQIKLSAEDYDGASTDLGKVSDVMLELRERDPSSEQYKYLLARTFSDIGFVFLQKDNMDGARQMHQKAAELFAELIQQNPQVEDYQYHLALCLNQQGELESNRDKILDAVKWLQRIVALRPSDHRYRFQLAYGFGRLAEIQRDEGQPEDAIKLNALAIELLDELISQEPDVARYKLALATQNSEIAQLKSDLEKYNEASEHLAQSVKLLDSLQNEEPSNPDYLREVAKTWGTYGFVTRKLGDASKAKTQTQAAIDAWNKLLQVSPEDAEAKGTLDWLNNQLTALNKAS